MSAPDVVVQGLDAWLGRGQVITGVDLVCPGGQITAVLGSAEASKSMLLRTINRLAEEIPGYRREGDVRIGGLEVSEIAPEALRRLAGMVFDVPTPFPMSIFENIAFALRVSGVERAELDQRVEVALREADLWQSVGARLSHPASSLEPGEQQLLCLARALALRPTVLLLDEPTASLGPVASARLEATILSQRTTRTVILATRDVHEAGRVADTTAFMERGRVVEAAPTEVLFTRPSHPATEAYLSRRFSR